MSHSSIAVKLDSPFQDQEPGTSGLRKNVKIFKQTGYTESFVQSILSSVGPSLKGSTIVLGGDGRYFVKEAAQIIVQMCLANGVKKVLVGQNGILSTPAASNLIRKTKSIGGILLTASHNPGGPDKDFGIKFNTSNGGPAPTNVTQEIFDISKTLKEYKIVPGLVCQLDKIGSSKFQVDGATAEVEVIDSVADYLELMKEIFDFGSISSLFKGGKFRVLIDSMHGVTGPYAKRIFETELGAAAGSVINSVPLEDFGGGHPDPNLTYAEELVTALGKGEHDFGAAFDGDGDRNMILGKNAFFVTPSDSLAVLAANLKLIPYFQKHGVNGLARSMPTAAAVDRVGADLKVPVYETPTGWKFFGNLMDAGKVSLCGEESFGTGSDHIREKDGIWAVLAWLSVLAKLQDSVEGVVTKFWLKYGRNYAMRYDYEGVESDGARKMMAELESKITSPSFAGTALATYTVKGGDNFAYKDPTDNSVTSKQGLRIMMSNGSRIIFRLSGTGSQGATIRMYLEEYTTENVTAPASQVFATLSSEAIRLADIARFTGRTAPTVIT
ncbi:phosphoglucomutase [Nesidiocoris tenuis]|uniref:phosphoglucomutase (alpha-D-glucose-1,6-bisphosphate-dependent) n=1 Tax=Nesidiocoris tenuis TaxID=355587 RepID=A0ABN7B2I6_9HEMI|nr:phosphoglucomutase [Nesidiocoris tenuis]